MVMTYQYFNVSLKIKLKRPVGWVERRPTKNRT